MSCVYCTVCIVGAVGVSGDCTVCIVGAVGVSGDCTVCIVGAVGVSGRSCGRVYCVYCRTCGRVR